MGHRQIQRWAAAGNIVECHLSIQIKEEGGGRRIGLVEE